ncbi:hypothetical protein QBC45DRAFT_432150 [Copromyces sp. CBS 386.78]|nr:hypothetical protein QBC45DRAFT_432150 [Copromyces sp. CBS 386.78]
MGLGFGLGSWLEKTIFSCFVKQQLKMLVASRLLRGRGSSSQKVYGLDPDRIHVMTRWEALMIFWDSLVIFGLEFGDGGFGVRDEWFRFFGVQVNDCSLSSLIFNPEDTNEDDQHLSLLDDDYPATIAKARLPCCRSLVPDDLPSADLNKELYRAWVVHPGMFALAEDGEKVVVLEKEFQSSTFQISRLPSDCRELIRALGLNEESSSGFKDPETEGWCISVLQVGNWPLCVLEAF